jgi:PAS domain S-box-containing protein
MEQAAKHQLDHVEILRLAAIVESSEDAIIGKDLNGIVQSWNSGAEQLYGYSREEMRGRPMNVLVPSDRFGEEASLLRAIQAGERVRHFETVRVRKGGERVAVSLTISPIFDTDGTIVGASHVARDISEDKEFEQRMQQMQKLEGLGVLAGGIAHDFNNLLTGMLGNAGLALDSLPEGSPARAGLLDVVRGAERASALTHQILAYAGKGRSVVETLSLSEVVKEIAHLIEALIPRNVQLRLELDPASSLIEGDAGQLQQVIMNLVLNGAEAIGAAGGSVVVLIGPRQVDELCLRTVLAGSLLAAGRYTVLEVRDTGCGMDEATQAKIFDPFFTTKFSGRGLGLAAVMGIVREHRGALKVYSAPGQGSTFKVLFPVLTEPAPALRGDESAQSLRGSGHILVADDEELIRTFAKAALEHFGYTVTLARDGREAVNLFDRSPDAFDLVFLDLTMPVINGEEVFRHLQTARPGLPVLLSSGYNENAAVRQFAGKGLAGFIQKPYSTRSLAERIKATLSSRGL